MGGANMNADARLKTVADLRTAVRSGTFRFHDNHLKLALELGGVGVWLLDLHTGHLVASDVCAMQFGLPRGADMGTAGMLLATLHPEDQPRQSCAFKQASLSGRKLDVRCRSVWPDGTHHWIHMTGCIVSDNRSLMAGISRDVTAEQRLEEDRQRIQEQMTYRAYHDPLTGLNNRSHFEACLRGAVGQAAPFSLLYLDLDEFKRVNDTFGHQVGDALLRRAAKRLEACIREQDTIARYGGDEFVIIQMSTYCAGDAALLARRIINVLGQPYEIDGQTVSIGVSIGITIVADRSTRTDTILRDADVALYKAKRAGRGIYCFSASDHSCDIRGEADIDIGTLAETEFLHRSDRR
jgi:diguanylate cyclase (GGDEF)-like protein